MTRQIAACLALAYALVGCSGESSQGPNNTTDPQGSTPTGSTARPAESFTHVIAVEVEYYTTGPQQGRPPDGKFAPSTKVNVIQEAGSYTQVRSADGVEAYVASDAIKEIEP